MVAPPIPLIPGLAFVLSDHVFSRWHERLGPGTDPRDAVARAAWLPGKPRFESGRLVFLPMGWDDVHLFDDETEMVFAGKWDGDRTIHITTAWCGRKFRS